MMTLLGAISHLSRPRCPAHWSGKRVYDDGGGGDDDGDVMMIIVGAVSHLFQPCWPAHWFGKRVYDDGGGGDDDHCGCRQPPLPASLPRPLIWV